MSVSAGKLGRYRAETPMILRERAQRIRAIVRDFKLREGAERINAFADELENQARNNEPEENLERISQ